MRLTVAGETPADAYGSCGGLRRLPALDNCAHHALSTKRRQTGIVMDVHPVLRGITEASQLQLPRAEPDEQRIESSQVEQLRQMRPRGRQERTVSCAPRPIGCDER